MSVSNLQDKNYGHSLGLVYAGDEPVLSEALNFTLAQMGAVTAVGALFRVTINIPSITNNSVVSCLVINGAEATVLDAWIAKCVPNNGSLNVFFSGNPTGDATFKISVIFNN
jgi:hypothetical protein